jgi:hypothetical protein
MVRENGFSVARAAPEARTGGDSRWRGAVNFQFAPSGAPPPLILFGGEAAVAFVLAAKLGREARREDESACFTSPRVRGEVERAKRTRVRGPLRDSELRGRVATVQRSPATLRQRRRPLTPPSPRTRGEGAASVSLIVSSSASVAWQDQKERNRRAKTQRARSEIAKISRSVLRRPGAGRAGLLRFFRFLALLPLSAVSARPWLPRRQHRLHRRPPRWRVPPFRRGKSARAGAHPERRRRARAPRVDERLLHRDLAA